MSAKRDPVDRLLEFHQRFIRRGTSWWVGSADRFQAGDLEPASWLRAYERWLDGVLADANELLDSGRQDIPAEGEGGKGDD